MWAAVRRFRVAAGVAALAMVAGVALGVLASGPEPSQPAAEPTGGVPEECLLALDQADLLVGAARHAGSDGTVTDAELADLVARLERSPYWGDRDACRELMMDPTGG